MARMKIEDRKAQVLQAAMDEFAVSGLHGTSTEAIAERAGVSQPYLFRLFGTKTELMTAAIEHATDRVQDVFRAAVADREDGMSPLQAMGWSYLELLQDDAHQLRCQLHTWAAASDPAIKDVAQRTYRDIWDEVTRLSGADHETVREFMAYGMLLTVLASLGQLDLYGDPASTLEDF